MSMQLLLTVLLLLLLLLLRCAIIKQPSSNRRTDVDFLHRSSLTNCYSPSNSVSDVMDACVTKQRSRCPDPPVQPDRARPHVRWTHIVIVVSSSLKRSQLGRQRRSHDVDRRLFSRDSRQGHCCHGGAGLFVWSGDCRVDASKSGLTDRARLGVAWSNALECHLGISLLVRTSFAILSDANLPFFNN